MDSITLKMDRNKKIEDSLELFEKFIVQALSDDDEEMVEDLNADIIDLIIDNHNFKKDLEEALYRNLEKLTHKKFILEGKEHAPSVRNWLFDFIKTYGSGMFDNVALSRFLTDSPNIRALDAGEKKMVRKLLTLYRNLKFFPESMGEKNPEYWEIVPIDRGLEQLVKNRQPITPPKTVFEEEIELIKAKGSGSGRIIENPKHKKIKLFQAMAKQYPERSLERRAIEEEIKKIG